MHCHKTGVSHSTSLVPWAVVATLLLLLSTSVRGASVCKLKLRTQFKPFCQVNCDDAEEASLECSGDPITIRSRLWWRDSGLIRPAPLKVTGPVDIAASCPEDIPGQSNMPIRCMLTICNSNVVIKEAVVEDTQQQTSRSISVSRGDSGHAPSDTSWLGAWATATPSSQGPYGGSGDGPTPDPWTPPPGCESSNLGPCTKAILCLINSSVVTLQDFKLSGPTCYDGTCTLALQGNSSLSLVRGEVKDAVVKGHFDWTYKARDACTINVTGSSIASSKLEANTIRVDSCSMQHTSLQADTTTILNSTVAELSPNYGKIIGYETFNCGSNMRMENSAFSRCQFCYYNTSFTATNSTFKACKFENGRPWRSQREMTCFAPALNLTRTTFDPESLCGEDRSWDRPVMVRPVWDLKASDAVEQRCDSHKCVYPFTDVHTADIDGAVCSIHGAVADACKSPHRATYTAIVVVAFVVCLAIIITVCLLKARAERQKNSKLPTTTGKEAAPEESCFEKLSRLGDKFTAWQRHGWGLFLSGTAHLALALYDIVTDVIMLLAVYKFRESSNLWVLYLVAVLFPHVGASLVLHIRNVFAAQADAAHSQTPAGDTDLNRMFKCPCGTAAGVTAGLTLGLVFPWGLWYLWVDLPMMLLHAVSCGKLIPWLHLHHYADLHSFLTAVTEAPFSALVTTIVYANGMVPSTPVYVTDYVFLQTTCTSLAHMLLWVWKVGNACAKKQGKQLFRDTFWNLLK